MRTVLGSVALLAAACIPVAAHADTFNITLTPSGGSASTFQLTMPPPPTYFSNFDYPFTNVQFTTGGVSTTIARLDLLNVSIYGGEDLLICSTNANAYCPGAQLSYAGPQLYINDNTLITGTYSLTGIGNSNATITIADATVVAATPEPSSLLMLATGVLGAAGAARRRFRR